MPKSSKSLAKKGLTLLLAAAITIASGICPVLSRAAGTVTADAAVRGTEAGKRAPAITVCRKRCST